MNDIEPQEHDAPAAAEPEGPNTEDRARMHGWKDKDAWVAAGRDPEQHTTAEAFLEPAEQRFQLLKANTRDLEKKFATTEKELAQMKKFQERNLKMIQEDADRRVQEAIESMDADAIKNAYAQKHAADKDAEEFKQEQVTPAPSAEVINWQLKNSWYGSDAELTALANSIDRDISSQNPHMSTTGVLATIERRMARFLPAQRPTVNPVTPTRHTSTGAKKGGFESLNADEKANFHQNMVSIYGGDTADNRKKYYDSLQRYDNNKIRSV